MLRLEGRQEDQASIIIFLIFKSSSAYFPHFILFTSSSLSRPTTNETMLVPLPPNGKYPPEEGQITRLPESACDIVNFFSNIYL